MKSLNTEAYKKFIEEVELKRITNVLGRYRRTGDFSESKKKTELTVETARASFDPPYIHSENNLAIPVGYRIEVKLEDDLLAEFEYHYEVVFVVDDNTVVENALEDTDLVEFLTGYQMDKLIWSYLRSNLSETCSRMGIRQIVLPLLR